MTTLTRAHNEWAKRRDDERFASLAAIHEAALADRAEALTPDTDYRLSDFRAVAHGDTLKLVGKKGNAADFTNWSFGQFCREAAAPSTYLAKLPADLAATCINHGIVANMASLESADDAKNIRVMMTKAQDGADLKLRSISSDKYSRIWNADLTAKLLELEARGPWQPAPAAFDGSRGLYLGDRDMFCFMVDSDRRIFETNQEGGLSRGFFLSNSEVGAQAVRLTTFFYEYVCGNHRVWGASNVVDVSIRHVGDIQGKVFVEMLADLRKYAESSAADDEARFMRAKQLKLGNDADEVLQKVYGLRVNGLSQKTIKAAQKLGEQRADWYGEPNTVWSMAGALTEIARDMPNANDRAGAERAAGKVMDLIF